MNQVSPRVFEAAAARAALILFEGDYSGVVEADVHYIPLKKDFSNLDEVFERLKDVAALEEMVERTYRDLISSGRFSYEKFVHQFDETLLKSLRARQSNVFPGSVGLERSLLLGDQSLGRADTTSAAARMPCGTATRRSASIRRGRRRTRSDRCILVRHSAPAASVHRIDAGNSIH